MTEIEIKNLSVFYGDVCALKDINLTIKDKDFLGIIGPNGSGKTTLLKVFLGLIEPTKGTITKAKDIKIGYVPQFSSFDTSFPIKVLDVILMGLLNKKINLFHKYSKEDLIKTEAIMKKLGICPLKDREIGQLSGGQMQKVLIARALIMDSKILILDEPTASLDATASSEIYELLEELNKEKTIIIVSHDVGIVSSYIDSVACLNKSLHYHGKDININKNVVEKVYGCPFELVAHGNTPHRVLSIHEEEHND